MSGIPKYNFNTYTLAPTRAPSNGVLIPIPADPIDCSVATAWTPNLYL